MYKCGNILRNALRISVEKITQSDDFLLTSTHYFRADSLIMPGSPPVGQGFTEDMAIVNLLENLLCDGSYRDIMVRELEKHTSGVYLKWA